MSITDFFFGPWIPQMIPTGSLDGNISITFTICFATVLHEGKKEEVCLLRICGSQTAQ